ncbi:MAG: hypothetical protein A2521_11405 [Deltaproteobacteria bacterium RIFOXYD12_FULL_57_12]|nr:MAG: hypothetical protein A2521_11405 [Deltaproteobacteria bacterium RIFOXYD12_FULL_57_12]
MKRFLLPAFIAILIVLNLLVAPVRGSDPPISHYTVVIWSFQTKDGALREFDAMVDNVPPDKRGQLRIELTRDGYSLRIGKFPLMKQAEALLQDVIGQFPTARVMRSSSSEENIVKIYKLPAEETVVISAPEPSPEQPPVETTLAVAPTPPTKPTPTISHEEPRQEISPEPSGRPATIPTAPAVKPAASMQPKEPTPLPAPAIMKKQEISRGEAAKPADATLPLVSQAEFWPDPDREYYTVQVASFEKAAPAQKKYAELEWQLQARQRAYLRLEKIKGYYALRVGRFDTEQPASELLAALKDTYPTAQVKKAFILKNRIHRIYPYPQDLPLAD